MTRKHFVAIADTIWTTAQELNLSETDHRRMAQEMAGTVSQFNSNFDRQRFIDRCMDGWKN